MVLALIRTLRAAVIIAAAIAASIVCNSANARDVMIFAAATLKDALDEAAASFQAQAHVGATVSYGSSAALVKQIENGAPADMFISADADWMNDAERRGCCARRHGSIC
jgi:molybdate transport system substrate-binding protein